MGALRAAGQSQSDPPHRVSAAAHAASRRPHSPFDVGGAQRDLRQFRRQAQPVRKGVRQAAARRPRRTRVRKAGLMITDIVVHGLFMLFAISFMMGLATVFTWVERKQSALMSDRIGANRCYIRVPFTNVKFVAWGLFHGIADGGKLLLKENFTPHTYDRLCYNLGPWLAAVPVLLLFTVIPFGGTLRIGDS